MKRFECFHCGTLLMRALLVMARVEIKCTKCNAKNLWEIGDSIGAPLDRAAPSMVVA